MKTIEYHPTEGEPITDGTARERVMSFLRSDTDYVKVGSEVFILWARVMVHDRRFPHDQLRFLYRNQPIPIDRNGRLPEHPDGFCDQWDTALSRLLEPTPIHDNPL